MASEVVVKDVSFVISEENSEEELNEVMVDKVEMIENKPVSLKEDTEPQNEEPAP